MRAGKFILAILIAAAAMLCNCGTESAVVFPSSDGTTSASSPAISSSTVYINYEHDSFVPASITVPAGTTVVWQVSEDYAHHWVVCDAVPFRGWFYEWFPFKYVFTDSGTYSYYDGANPAINGIVVVY